MSYASIMVHLEWDAEADARVALAAGLAERFNAELAANARPARIGPKQGRPMSNSNAYRGRAGACVPLS
jgi:hypothetical protein